MTIISNMLYDLLSMNFLFQAINDTLIILLAIFYSTACWWPVPRGSITGTMCLTDCLWGGNVWSKCLQVVYDLQHANDPGTEVPAPWSTPASAADSCRTCSRPYLTSLSCSPWVHPDSSCLLLWCQLLGLRPPMHLAGWTWACLSSYCNCPPRFVCTLTVLTLECCENIVMSGCLLLFMIP